MGAYYYGQQADSFNGTPNYGQYGLYWQADQMLFRESSPEEPAPMGKSPSGGKSFKQAVQTETARLSKQGLYTFNLVSFAPNYNNLYPFYFQTGFVYVGLIPSRNTDRMMFAIAYGSYSSSNIQNLQNSRRANQPNYSLVLEWDYRFQINEWACIQPFVQYFVQPNGTGTPQNATILGFSYALNF